MSNFLYWTAHEFKHELRQAGIDFEWSDAYADSPTWPVLQKRIAVWLPTRRWTMSEIEKANEKAGHYFFESSTKRFFNSRILGEVFQGPGGVYFVTSERFDHRTPRLYTIRSFDPKTGDVNTVGEFQAYKAARTAKKYAQIAAQGETR